ncbi:MAG: pyridoxamine 5'-phosphate oxidase family protein [Mycobacterium sp.]|nr:pyridoxamine 5'-phosphate oxidase family protein [Mycobacterium sp.]
MSHDANRGAPGSTATASTALAGLTRKRERSGDRELVDEVFDEALVATVSTVIDDEPWSVPMLVVRHDARLLLHGSTGAGALRQVADGAKVVISAFILDGVVVAERQFEHSANYRSAVVRGRCRVVDGAEIATTLDLFTNAILAGRSGECPPHTRAELAQSLVLELAITDDNWVSKRRSGPPSSPSDQWTGIIPIVQTCQRPISASTQPVPRSVTTFIDTRNGPDSW